MNLYPHSACCPICQQHSKQGQPDRTWLSVNCSNCGEFVITDDAQHQAKAIIGSDDTRKAKGSHYIQKRLESGKQTKIYSNDIQAMVEMKLPSIIEQADNFIRHFAKIAKEPGKLITIDSSEEWIGATGCISKSGVNAILDYLLAEGKMLRPYDETNEFCISVKGWVYYEDLQKKAKDSTIAFMAMQFGEPELDAIVDDTFRPAVLQTGFRLQKLNDEQSAGLIDDQLRVQIRRSRFLIADLTHGNKGAYWEAGFSEGIGIPVIYTCKESEFGKESHFDTNHHLTVMWNPDKPEEAANKLKATIRATLPESAKMEDD